MVAIASVVGAVGGIITFLSSLPAEGWTRWLVIVAFMGIDSGVGATTGVYLIEGLIESVFYFLFKVELIIPKVAGLSMLVPLVVLLPVFFYCLKHE